MAKFTRYSNPNKKHPRKHLSRSEADIVAGSWMVLDRSLGIERPLTAYDEISDRLTGEPSRNTTREQEEN